MQCLEIYALVDEELIDAEYGDKSQSTDPFTRLSQLAHTKNIFGLNPASILS